jgi:hypothetical protein
MFLKSPRGTGRALLIQLTVCVLALAGCADSKCEPGCEKERDAGDSDAAPGGPPHIDKDAAPMEPLDEPPPDAGTLPYACEVGVMDGVTRQYATLLPGETIPIGGTGQAGLVARLALRCTPLADSPPLDMAEVDLLLVNPFTAITAPRKSRPRNYDLACGEDGACDVIPILVEISHLAKLPELEGLPVRVDVIVRATLDDSMLRGPARSHGVFRRL